ncbi:MAG: hypothetical protein VYB72_09110 [Planctomycetota bacterium]|nr:hypothetical protein [Planctomycetota bacterium]
MRHHDTTNRESLMPMVTARDILADATVRTQRGLGEFTLISRKNNSPPLEADKVNTFPSWKDCRTLDGMVINIGMRR